MSQTTRQALIDVLSEGPCTLRDLSQAVGISEREAADHLPHIARSLARQNRTLELHPAFCHACGFTFSGRKRVSRPSRCPECRAERIQPPAYEIR